MDNEDERDDKKEATVTGLPPELVDIERDFASRAGSITRIPITGPGFARL